MTNHKDEKDKPVAGLHPLSMDSGRDTDGEFDIIELISVLWERKWFISGATVVIVAMTIAVMLKIPKTYRVSSTITYPSQADVSKINYAGLEYYTRQDLLNIYYEEARSPNTIKEYVDKNSYLPRFFPNHYSVENDMEYFSALLNSYELIVLEDNDPENEAVVTPRLIEVGLRSGDEQLMVEFINSFIVYVNRAMMDKLQEAQLEQRSVLLSELQERIEIKRQDAKTKRELLIMELQEEQQKTLVELRQQRELLISLANANRETTVFTKEKRNNLRIEQLEQRRELLIEKAKKDRINQIAHAREALTIANELGLSRPTKLEDVGRQGEVLAQTQINLAEKRPLPLYLMGTRYLSTYIKTLQERESDIEFMNELSQIDADIKALKEDKEIAALKSRESDAPFLAQLNEIDKNIILAQNNVQLKTLQERKTDDPYIPELPELLSEISRLSSMSIDFDNIKAYSLTSSAFKSGMAIEPKRAMIVGAAGMAGFIFACLVALVTNAVSTRLKRNYS